jgi:3-dehydroquinate synthase II
MKKIIIRILESWSDALQKSMIQAALNQGFTGFYVTGTAAQKMSGLEKRELFSPDLSLPSVNHVLDGNVPTPVPLPFPPGESYGFDLTISSKDDEKRAIRCAKEGADFLICKATDWKIIPFENLIANLSTLETQLYADVGGSLADAELLLHTLEKGVDGLVFTPKSENDLIDLKKYLKKGIILKIEPAKIKAIKAIPEADRVCVDTSSMLRPGEGMLVGNTAKGFALVHAEVFESEFVNSRPFRVNAGDVSDYILVPQFNTDGTIGTRTNYLSELKAGDSVLIVNLQGECRIVSIGRVKIETRPMLLFELEVEREKTKIPLLTTVQNAETVRLVNEKGVATSSTKLKVGDSVLVHVGPGATHFGTTIKETIIEK